jgi:glutamyl-tRNA reductase
MDLELTVIGISHRTAPLAVRERYVVSQEDLPACLAAIASVPSVSEAFLLSTCNRSEVLVVGKPEREIAAGVRAHLFRNLGDEEVYVWSGLQALIHVFRVASGLDSVVVGESEVPATTSKATSRV